jgi:bacteriorhodopsin
MLKGKLNFTTLLAMVTVLMMATLMVLVIATPIMDEVVSGTYKYAFILVSAVYITIRVRRLIIKLKE